jgi:hypothetical protein
MARSLSLALLVSTTLATAALPAQATDCAPPTGISPCVNAQTLWLAPGQSRFVGIASPHTVAPGAASIGMATSFMHRPIVLAAPSPDPEGREVVAVGDVVDASILFGLGLTSRVELTVATPMALRQSGAGAEGATSQRAAPLTRTAARDPRVGAGYALVDAASPLPGFGAKARLELALPLGDEGNFAGEPSPVLAPTLALGFRSGRLSLGSEVGLRIRETTALASARVGTQVLTTLGAAVDVLDGELLAVGVEAWLLPTLASQDHAGPDGRRREDGLLAPAEWHLSLRSAPTADDSLVIQLGAGMGLPISSERSVDTGETEHFLGVTTPLYRFVAAVRWVPSTPRARDH